jgi:two-component system chemotaxis sensor kinase CheA
LIQPDQRQAQVRETFAAELGARVPALNRGLMRLEQTGPDPALREAALWDLFREVHNLKAAARVVEHAMVERAARVLETTLADARLPGANPPTGDWFDAAYALVDTLARVQTMADSSEPDVDTPAAGSVDPQLTVLPVQPRPAIESVRVAVDKLDALLAQASELAVTHLRVRQRQSELRALREECDASQREWRNTRNLRASLRRGGRPSRQLEVLLRLVEQAEQHSVGLLQRVDELSVKLDRDTAQLGLVTRAVESEVMAVRLLPIATAVTLLERTLRDLTRSTGKDVELVVEGAETEIDRKILEHVRDPLVHLMRNAVDHGIEPPGARVASGKPRTGIVRLSAALRGGFVEIELSDDGAGLDTVQLRASAVRKGLLTDDQASAADDATIMDIIFQPGFSTRTSVTELSGRG